MLAFADVTKRHDSLRVAFDLVAHDPKLSVRTYPDPPLEFLDTSAHSHIDQRTGLEELAFCESRRRFDLHTGPLWHAWVVRHSSTSHWVVVCFSHLIGDGWSTILFFKELLEAYSVRIGERLALSPQPASLAELDTIQRLRLRPLSHRLSYWRSRLVIQPDQPALAPKATGEADVFAARGANFSIPPDSVTGVRRIAWQVRTTDYVALMAAYHLLLALATGKSRTVISTATLSGTTMREMNSICQHAIYPCVSTELPESCSLRDIVRHTHTALTSAVSNMVSFKTIARIVNPDFEASRPWPSCHLFDGKLFDGGFDSLAETLVAGLRVARPALSPHQPPDYSASLLWSALTPSGRRSVVRPSIFINGYRHGGTLMYNSDLFPGELIDGFLACYLRIVHAIGAEPDMTVGALRERCAPDFGT
jgi:hypothetical protein